MAAISPGGTPSGDELFATEGHAAITAVAGLDADSCFVNEHFSIFSVLAIALYLFHTAKNTKYLYVNQDHFALESGLPHVNAGM